MCGMWEFAQRYGSLLSVTCLRLSRTDFELYRQGPIKSNSGASQKKNKRLMSAEK